MKENKKIILLIVLIILLTIIFVVQYVIGKFVNYDPTEKAIEEYGYETMGVYKDPQLEEQLEAEKKVSYQNIEILRDLKGQLPASTVVKKVKKAFVEEIPKVLEETKDMSNQELIKYYTDNEFDIQNNLRIDNQTSFLNMLNKFKNLTCNIETDYKTCEFLEEDTFKLKFSYENGETIECNLVGDNANTIIFEF